MKRLTAALCLCTLLSSTAFAAGAVDVSLRYESLDGKGTNQFAIWVENENGNVVKTLFVTNFAGAKRGWKERPALVNWVKQVDAASLTDAELDAISGPTPDSGDLTYSWDLTDSKGQPVPDGTYAIVVEGSVRGENAVIYSSEVKLPLKAEVQTAEAKFIGGETEDHRMITNVTITSK